MNTLLKVTLTSIALTLVGCSADNDNEAKEQVKEAVEEITAPAVEVVEETVAATVEAVVATPAEEAPATWTALENQVAQFTDTTINTDPISMADSTSETAPWRLLENNVQQF